MGGAALAVPSRSDGRQPAPHRSRGDVITPAMSTRYRHSLPLLVVLALAPLGAHAHAETGTPVDNVEMKTLSGGKARLLSARAKANVVIFFRPNQERSLDALKQMAACEREFSGKPVHWVAVVSSSAEPEEVRTTVAQAGLSADVLVDENDALYDKLGIRLHPMVALVDQKFRLAAVEMYRQVEYCDIIRARIKILLGEADQAALDKAINPEKSALPGRDDPQRKAMRDVNLARRMLEIGQPDLAMKSAQRALEIAPVAEAYAVMGDAWQKKGNCAAARKAYDSALKLDPKDARAIAGQKACP
jgi:tetratricopeptide (TPR) repeat protein